MAGVKAAEVEETVACALVMEHLTNSGSLLEILAVINLVYGCVHILMSEKLQRKREKIGVKKKLGQVFEFQDIWLR